MDILDELIRYLRGQKLQTRTDDPRAYAEYLEAQVIPQLHELAALKAKKGKAA
jgi:hypothetical protein